MTNSIYSKDLIGIKQSVTDEILLLNPNQTPMLNLLGFSEPVIGTTHGWYEDEVFATKSTVTTAATAAATELIVADTEAFRPDSVVQIDEEMLLITAVDTLDNKITVVRGYANSTAAAIAKDDEIEFQFDEGVEGADARESRYKARQRVENLTQIFTDSVEVTDTAQTVGQYGISDLYGYEKAKKQVEVALQLEKALINGLSYDSKNVRQMKGIRSFIQSNVKKATTAVNIEMLNDISQKIYENGGFASGGRYAFIVPAKQKRAISDLRVDGLRLTQAETSRGQVVDHIENDFGRFPVVMNDNLKSDELLFIDQNRAFIKPLGNRVFSHELLAKTGDSTRGQIVGEYTLEFRQEKAHARIKGLK